MNCALFVKNCFFFGLSVTCCNFLLVYELMLCFELIEKLDKCESQEIIDVVCTILFGG